MLDLLGRQPQAPQPIRRRVRWNLDRIVFIDNECIGVAAAVRDPYAAALTHERIERDGHATGRRLRDDRASRLVMLVHPRLTIGHDDEPAAGAPDLAGLRQRRTKQNRPGELIDRDDCHGQGRAVDFSGVVGTKDGAAYTLSVLRDWGMVSTLSTPGGIWQPTGTNQVHFRLDDAPGSELARDFFRSAYAFIAGQWQDHSPNPDGPAEPSTIGSGTFIMNPDHPTSNPAPGAKNGREAHANHLHMQIGVTGTA